MSGTSLDKFDASGNVFLVMLRDEVSEVPLSEFDGSELARERCDAESGAGADGLIVAEILSDGAPWATEDGRADARMRLWNSDGSEAAVSGNCLLCLAHALARHWDRMEVDIGVDTRARLRRCTASRTDESDVMAGSVVLAAPRPGPRPQPEDADLVAVLTEAVGECRVRRWDTVDVGNPHIVIEVGDPAAVPLERAGRAVESLFGGGINVHFAERTGENELSIRTWERGAGVTAACGTGAVASAHAFRQWGMVGDRVRVCMPGGNASTEVQRDGSVKLAGSSRHVGSVEDRAVDAGASLRTSLDRPLAGVGS